MVLSIKKIPNKTSLERGKIYIKYVYTITYQVGLTMKTNKIVLQKSEI